MLPQGGDHPSPRSGAQHFPGSSWQRSSSSSSATPAVYVRIRVRPQRLPLQASMTTMCCSWPESAIPLSVSDIPPSEPAGNVVKVQRELPPYALRAGRCVCDSLWPDKQSTKSQETSLRGIVYTACYSSLTAGQAVVRRRRLCPCLRARPETPPRSASQPQAHQGQ